MKREHVAKILPILQAFAEGKTIQISCSDGWNDLCDNPTFECSPSSYRIKPSPKYRPFKDAEECWQEMLKHQPFGWVKALGNIGLVKCLNNGGIVDCDDERLDFNEAFKIYTFADGAVFGVKEESV